MSVFRSYFSKNNTIISGNKTNSSQNPVTEISYGTYDKQVSRYLFDIDLSELKKRIDIGYINSNRIKKHILHLTNTISFASEYLGKKSYNQSIDRASSFQLDVFNIKQPWDEGSGYVFDYSGNIYNGVVLQASNWYSATTSALWHSEGAYVNGVSEIIGTQNFEKGNKNIDIDITDYINQRLFGSGNTNNIVYSGDSYGLGIKFVDELENLNPFNRQAVAFHAKNTNTFYEPYVETIIDDTIVDDRNYFYLDKYNDLYLYVRVGNENKNVVVNYVNIYDYKNNLVAVFSGDSIDNVSFGIYKITFNIDSKTCPDSVLFRDEWNVTIDDVTMTYDGEFYILPSINYYMLNNENDFNFDNYYFNFKGINDGEHISRGEIRKIKLLIKQYYSNQNNNIPLDIEYRLYTTVGRKYELDIIPFTKVNRTAFGYEFNLDTTWLIPQDYRLQIRLKNGYLYENKEIISFSVVSNDFIK